jgi:hypothetical protein
VRCEVHAAGPAGGGVVLLVASLAAGAAGVVELTDYALDGPGPLGAVKQP